MVRGPWGDRRTRAVLVPVGFSRVVSVCRHVPDRTSSWIIIPVPQYWDGLAAIRTTTTRAVVKNGRARVWMGLGGMRAKGGAGFDAPPLTAKLLRVGASATP